MLLLVGYLPGHPGFQFVETVDWIPVFGIQYKLGADGLSVALVVLTTTLTWISILASFKPIQTRIKEYMISFLVLEVGLIGVFLALDTFLFYIFWEIVLVPMYLIIGIWGGSNRIYATIKFVLYTLVGSLLMLVAILATAFAYQAGHDGSWAGAFDFEALKAYAATGGFADGLQLLAFLAFFLAFAIKVPMFPFHTWLPDAHTEAPTAGSVMLAAIMLKLGAYGFIRFALPLYPDAAQTFAPVIIVLSLIAIIYGAIVALVQPDLKTPRGVLVGQPHGLRHARHLRVHRAGPPGRGPPDDQPRPHHGRPLPAGRRHLRADPRPDDRQDGRAVGADAGLRRVLRVLRVRVGRAAGAVRVRRRVPGAGRHLRGPARDAAAVAALRDDPGRRLPAVHVRPGRVRRAVRRSSRASATT